MHPKPKVTQRFDIWSLGCVFSEAATWILLGYRGVEQYRLVRKCVDGEVSSELKGDDCFYRKGMVSNPVLEWHKFLRESLRIGDHITGPILTLIEDKMLLGQAKDRISSSDLVDQLKDIVQKAEKEDSNYLPPRYFDAAFHAEQEKVTKEFTNPTQHSTPRKSNRYKSTRPQNSPLPLPIGSTVFENSKPQEFDQSLTAIVSQRKHAEELSSLRPKMETRIDTAFREASDYSTIHTHKRQLSPYGGAEDSARFDYWDACGLLESQGWVHTGALMRPSASRVTSSPAASTPFSTPSPGARTKTTTMPPATPARTTSILSRQKPTRRGSTLFSFLGKRNGKPESLPSWDSQLASPPAQSQHRTDTGALIGKIEVDTKYKQSDFDEFFKDRDIVSARFCTDYCGQH